MKEPKTIFGKVIAAILSIFVSNFAEFVAKLWKKVPTDLQDKFLIGVKIVERIKTWQGGTFAEFVEYVLNDEIKEDLREQIILLLRNKLVLDWDLDGDAAKIGSWELGSATTWQSLAAELNKEFTGVSFGQSVITTEAAYQSIKNA